MTALEQYIRLEAEALWQENATADPRSVIVSFGNASLVISDFKDAPLAHWTLAATRIVGRNNEEVVYAPDDTNSETLRISDELFVDAIRAVSASAIQQKPPKKWKSKAILGAVLVTVAACLVFLPAKIKNWVRSNVSDEQLVLITNEILDRADIDFCAEPRASEAMSTLKALVLQSTDKPVLVADIEAQGIVRLPDGRAIIDMSVIERAASADGFAGWLALAANMPEDLGGLDQLIQSSGTQWALQFAFTGKLTDEEYAQMTHHSLSSASPPDPSSVANALTRLQSAGIDPGGFRASINLPAKIENGPFRPSLNDQDWLALQRICAQ